MREKFYENKSLTIVYFLLRFAVIVVMVREIAIRNWNNVFMCILTLVLFLLPSIFERRLKIDVPNALEIMILFFIFAAEILGEIGEFYLNVPHWDTMLHTVNGFLMAAIGFAMIDILNQSPRFHINLSPVFVSFVSFCFSTTIGVFWEFFEYGVDVFFKMDMQKDTIVSSISSVALNPDGINVANRISGITQSVITGFRDGELVETVIQGGYLDIGLVDTMKDMLVNCVGAVVFSIAGYFYIHGRGRIAAALIPKMLTEEEIKEEVTVQQSAKTTK